MESSTRFLASRLILAMQIQNCGQGFRGQNLALGRTHLSVRDSQFVLNGSEKEISGLRGACQKALLVLVKNLLD